jgi:hypothetical protein
MSPKSGIELTPQIWNWWAGFFISMGSVLALAIALAAAVFISHWLYLRAKKIESEPTPISPGGAIFKLSAFGALALGAVLIPVAISVIFYALSSLVWYLAPAPVEAPALDFGSLSADEQISSMLSLVMVLFVLAAVIAGTIFFLLRHLAQKINPQERSPGLAARFLWNYFQEYTPVGVLLTLIACPVILYFLYNAALMVLVVVPAARQGLAHAAVPNAERIYLRVLSYVGSCFLLILLLPAIGLLIRATLLRARYTLENPYLRQIFIRSLKFSLIALLAWMGCISMYLLADAIMKLIFSLTV